MLTGSDGAGGTGGGGGGGGGGAGVGICRVAVVTCAAAVSGLTTVWSLQVGSVEGQFVVVRGGATPMLRKATLTNDWETVDVMPAENDAPRALVP
jgi:hypothetical protein